MKVLDSYSSSRRRNGQTTTTTAGQWLKCGPTVLMRRWMDVDEGGGCGCHCGRRWAIKTKPHCNSDWNVKRFWLSVSLLYRPHHNDDGCIVEYLPDYKTSPGLYCCCYYIIIRPTSTDNSLLFTQNEKAPKKQHKLGKGLLIRFFEGKKDLNSSLVIFALSSIHSTNNIS